MRGARRVSQLLREHQRAQVVVLEPMPPTMQVRSQTANADFPDAAVSRPSESNRRNSLVSRQAPGECFGFTVNGLPNPP